MGQKRFSVITIGTNNRNGFLQTKSSVENQIFTDYEWIIVDGASIDGTVDILKRLNHPNCTWKSEPHSNMFEALNKGLDRSTGEYVIFINSGDRFAAPDVLARIDAVLNQEKGNWDLVFGDAYEEDENGKLFFKAALPAWAITYGMFTYHPSMLYARRAVGSLRFSYDFRVAGDYEFTCRLLADGAARTLRVRFPISIFERGGNSEKLAAVGRKENLAIQKSILRLGPIHRAGNYALLLTSGLIRSHMRGVYDRLRLRQDVQAM